MAAFAKSPTKITGVEHLRIKSDRIAAPCNELAKVGCRTEQLKDSLILSPERAEGPEGPEPPERAARLEGPERPERPRAARMGHVIAPKQAFAAYNDHRMAAGMALFNLRRV